ncbi:hypothetical protein CNBG_10045 [Cryptococcus deuterogattii R265]|uniref:uncharacterized protein n=1 Tax=Cryptococcus deuterogattii (strain R265) TaxID=294750 RepID=UPI00193516E5|nr:hypothetical protein CNBG_10045 [Cryptococcus deuterogattii R265]
MTFTGTTEEDGASTRASALAQFTSDSPLTSLSTLSNSDPLLSPLPSPVRALPEHPKSPCDNLTTNGGHSKNKDRPYPLSLIPFDLSEPYEASENFTICSYDDACEVDYLGEDWANAYKNEGIADEQTFDDKYVRRYLDRFIKENPKMSATNFSHQANLKAVFYGRKDKEWAKLDLVDEYRRQTGKVLGAPSQSQSTSGSRRDGATTPDVSLIGYVKDSGCSLGWKPVLYAVVELKWTKLATHLAGEDKRKSDEKTLEYLCQEGVFQTMWYVILGYAISGCIFGLSMVNEYFYRIVYDCRASTSGIPVLALEADGEFMQKLGPHSGHRPDGYTVEELAELLDFWSSPPNRLISDRANAILNKEARYHLDATILMFLAHAASRSKQHSPSSDPPVPFFHGIPVPATAHSAARMRLKGLKAGRKRHSFHSSKRNKRTLTFLNEEEENEEETEEENKSKHSKPSGKDNDGSSGGNSGPGDDNSRRGGSHSGGKSRSGAGSRSGVRSSPRGAGGGFSPRRAEAFDNGTSMARREFGRGLERLSAPEGMLDAKTSIMASFISNSLGTCSRAPSPLSSNSSEPSDPFFDTSFNSNEKTLVNDDPSADPRPKFHESDPVDIDIEDTDSEPGELTLAAYKDRLAMLGVPVKLVTREEMDVLLARR